MTMTVAYVGFFFSCFPLTLFGTQPSGFARIFFFPPALSFSLMQFQSKLIENAVTELSKLPGIGRKTALRLVLNLLRADEKQSLALADALVNLRTGIRSCRVCHIAADSEDCSCGKQHRDQSLVCVVADLPDVLAIENTGQYRGLFHVLGGVISPMEGVGPDELHIGSLLERVAEPETQIKEVLLALPGSMEGETTAFFLARKLRSYPVKVSTIARGVPVGGDLEYADEVTLARSIASRTIYPTE